MTKTRMTKRGEIMAAYFGLLTFLGLLALVGGIEQGAL